MTVIDRSVMMKMGMRDKIKYRFAGQVYAWIGRGEGILYLTTE